MNALRIFGKIVGIALLHIGIWALVFFFIFSRLLATPDFLLESAQDNGVYSAAAEEIAAATAAEQTIEASGIALSEAETKSIIKQVLAPDFVQTQVETVVRSFYDWLEGNTPEPTFTLDASEERDALAALFSGAAVEKLEDLPECTTITQLDADALDKEITCIPPQFDTEEFEQTLRQELAASDEFFAETSVDSKELLGEEFDFANSNAPGEFQRASSSWWYGALILVVGVGLLVNLSRSKREGVRTVAAQLLVIGAGLGVLGLIGVWLGSTSISSVEATELEIALFSMLKDIGGVANYIVLVIASVCVLTGVAGLVLIKKPSQEPQPIEESREAEGSTVQTGNTGVNDTQAPLSTTHTTHEKKK